MILLTCPAKNIEQQDQGHELVQQDHGKGYKTL